MFLQYKQTSRYKITLVTELIKKVMRGNIYRLFKIKSSHLVAVDKNVTILGNKKDFIVGKNNKFESGAYIQTVSTNGVILGDNVTICQNAIIRPSGFFRMGADCWSSLFNWCCKLYRMFWKNYNWK